MKNLNTRNQSKNKITSTPGYSIGSFTCYNADDTGVTVQLTSLEEMWYSHEENINHPEGSELPQNINVPHMKIMRQRVFDSVLARTGIDVASYDSILHATTMPARDESGNIVMYGGEHVVRNVYA